MAKVLTVQRKTKYEEGTFGQMTKEGIYDALALLGKEGMQLYFYLTVNNVNGFNFVLSPTAIENALGVSKSVSKNITTRGYEQLKSAGFIKEDEKTGKTYFLADGSMLDRKTKTKKEKVSQ